MMTSEKLQQTDDDDLFLAEDEAAPESPHAEGCWRILVVDDDLDVHQATILALRDLQVEGQGLELLHAHSGKEACEKIPTIDGLAVILLDVVMETSDAGLNVVRYVREELKNRLVRIVLRTGQPGYAPELETIRDFDINDYRTKSELTRVRLYTCLATAIRTFKQMRTREDLHRGLEQIVRASAYLTKLHGMELFAEGVVSQISALLGVASDGLVCAQGGTDDDGNEGRIIAAAGQFRHLVNQPLNDLTGSPIQQALKRCLDERRNFYDSGLLLYFPGRDERGVAAYLKIERPLLDTDRHLLEVFCSSMSVGFENVALYARLIEQAYQDPLLHLPNLNRFLELLAEDRESKPDTTLALVDIDDFSEVNDALGHEFGDAILISVGKRLLQHLGTNVIARIGNDLFAILGPAAEVNAATLSQVFAEPFDALGQSIRVSATTGLAQITGNFLSGPDLLKNAHIVLKKAKQQRRGGAVYFSEPLGLDARERMQLIAALREAIDRNKLFLMYQPKVDLCSGKPTGLEALVRWRGAEGNLIPPDRFIPLAEQSGLMAGLGTFVLNTACHQLSQLRAKGHTGLTMAVNVSQAQLREPNFITSLEDALRSTGIPGPVLELEITESMAAEDQERTRELLEKIRDLGVKIAIDDFGTGFSSLSVLRHLPVDRLKIDRSFVAAMEQDDGIPRMVVALGHSMGMQITAEGIETMEQRQALRDMSCDEGQGWFFSHPIEQDGLLGWLDTAARTNTAL